MAQECNSVWATCPVDIMLVVLKKLDIKSLIDCMNVNNHWRSLVDYYCEHFNLWKTMLQYEIDDEGVTFAEKSKLDYREQFLSAQRWLSVGNVNVQLRHNYKLDCSIGNICVQKDNLIVLTDDSVNYFEIPNCELVQAVATSCIKYIETTSVIAEVSLDHMNHDDIVLYITNKLCANNINYEKSKTVVSHNLDAFIVRQNCCYNYSNRVLWMYTATKTGWVTETLAKYHGVYQFWGLHIFKKNVYLLCKSGTVLMVDMECKLFVKVFQFNIPVHARKWKPFMYHIYSLLYKVPQECLDRQVVFHGYRHSNFITTMARYGVTCVLQHGYTLLLGYENGTVEIYLTKNLVEPSESVDLCELRFNIRTFMSPAEQYESGPCIAALDIYEDNKDHHLFVSTASHVYELLL